jgi:hypothetical protein
MARAHHSPIDRAISGLHEAIAAPHRISLLKVELIGVFSQVVNRAHRSFLEDKFHEIEQARNSPRDLARLQEEIDRWNDREFPVRH